MSRTRNNHYVPRWYQAGFFEPGQSTLAYLDMTPNRHKLDDGQTVVERSTFVSPTKRCFRERDLYSTFFGTHVDDEIERRLFGAIDTAGADAVKAFLGDDVAEWHRHFETLFSFIDIQKVRTPKGLDWLRAQYPALTQNELMLEMQGIGLMNCTIWTEGVREIVSAEDAEVKFLVTDHPVTVYNPAMDPSHRGCTYPLDPPIALKASQTIFPLNRNFCLILTNLEYAKDPTTNPIEKRTFARNYRDSLVRTDAFIRTRKLTGAEVTQVNAILKLRARRFVAAGKEEWLYPEAQAVGAWRDYGTVLRPMEDCLWQFGGEIYAKFENGAVHYQDEFGRTKKPPEALQRKPLGTPKAGDPCGCGSGWTYRACCASRPVHLRPSWDEVSIRERNLALCRAITDILGFDEGKNWTDVRRDLTDDKISEVYGVFASLWPLETDLLKLLPKPDGQLRAVYTGATHPSLINEFAVGTCLYFGEVLIQHPFVHGLAMRKEMSPVENPSAYRQEVLKEVVAFLTLMPLVDVGLVNLVPDPCNFDFHLRRQMMLMAHRRAAARPPTVDMHDRTFRVMKEDAQRSLMLLPREALEAQLAKGIPGLEGVSLEAALAAMEQGRLSDPLATLQADSLSGGSEDGLLTLTQLAPNFEITMYLAQATGACIVTDSQQRGAEITDLLLRRGLEAHGELRALGQNIERSEFAFPQDELDVVRLQLSGACHGYLAPLADAFRYLSRLNARGRKPNFEAQIVARYGKAHREVQRQICKAKVPVRKGRMRVALPANGLQDNTVNRLLLMSSSEHHLPNVPMAFFMETLGR